MRRLLTILFAGGLLLVVAFLLLGGRVVAAQTNRVSPTSTQEESEATASATILEKLPTPTVAPRSDITREIPETQEPLHKLLSDQKLDSVFPFNPVKYAIRSAIGAGVSPNTVVLLLLLPGVAALIAAARHLIGLRGFGIFLPAALAVSFVATGPVIGVGLFLIIVLVSTITRFVLRGVKIKLQYLPRMALLLLFVVMGILGILFLAPILKHPGITNVSIFPVLILVLLAEDFSRVQLGKNAKVAINLTTETLILAFLSYLFLTTTSVQEFVLLNPEIFILSVLVFDFVLGKYVGLRVLELWRFRKLLRN